MVTSRADYDDDEAAVVTCMAHDAGDVVALPGVVLLHDLDVAVVASVRRYDVGRSHDVVVCAYRNQLTVWIGLDSWIPVLSRPAPAVSGVCAPGTSELHYLLMTSALLLDPVCSSLVPQFEQLV